MDARAKALKTLDAEVRTFAPTVPWTYTKPFGGSPQLKFSLGEPFGLMVLVNDDQRFELWALHPIDRTASKRGFAGIGDDAQTVCKNMLAALRTLLDDLAAQNDVTAPFFYGRVMAELAILFKRSDYRAIAMIAMGTYAITWGQEPVVLDLAKTLNWSNIPDWLVPKLRDTLNLMEHKVG